MLLYILLRPYSLQHVTYRCRCLDILHSIHSVQNEDVERIVIHANDTQIVVMHVCVLRFNAAERFVGTVCSHSTRQLSIYQSMRLRLHMVPQSAAHCRSSIV